MRDMTTAVFAELGKQINQVKKSAQETKIKNGPAAYAIRATMWHDEATALVGAALVAPVVNTAQPYNAYSKQAAGANGNTFTHSAPLQAGDYSFSVLGITGPDAGIIDWYIDDTLFLAGQDWYAAGFTFGVEKFGSFTVASDGVHVFKAVVNGKNALSSDYIIYLTKYSAKQAAD